MPFACYYPADRLIQVFSTPELRAGRANLNTV
jgi:hypothetical protein